MRPTNVLFEFAPTNSGATPKIGKSNALLWHKGTKMLDVQSVKDALHNGVVVMSFTKTNGELREMRCTLRADMIPAAPVVEGKTPKKENTDVQAVWDIEKQAWRSFRFDSVNTVIFETA